MGPVDLKAYNFYDGKWLSFEFESGVKVEGLNVTGIRNIKGKLMLIQLRDCTVSYQEEILFRPEEGIFHMVVGKAIISAFAGAADSNSFPNLYAVSLTRTVKSVKLEARKKLEDYYETVRMIREKQTNHEALPELFRTLVAAYPQEWLLYLEIFEIAEDEQLSLAVKRQLESLGAANPKLARLIKEGIEIIEKSEVVWGEVWIELLPIPIYFP